MSTTKSSGNGIAFRTLQPEQFHPTTGRPVKVADYVSPVFLDSLSTGMMHRYTEQFILNGISIGTEETQELEVLEKFLRNHVQENRICDIQCMMLWSEWVRTFRRQTAGYPKLVLEKEFRNVITENYDLKVANSSYRGPVYRGLKYVP